MIIPEILLGFALLVSIAWLGDATWRLWQGRAPRRFRPWPDSGLFVLMVFSAVQLPVWETRDLIAKVVLVVVIAVLAVILVIGRSRVPAES